MEQTDETTNYAIALPPAKNVILSLNIDTVDEEGNATASPVVYEEDKLIYMDMKIKRQSTTDNRTSLFVRDSAGREIYSILYDKGKMLPGSYETLSADVNYGSYDSEIPINYPRDDQCLKAISRRQKILACGLCIY